MIQNKPYQIIAPFRGVPALLSFSLGFQAGTPDFSGKLAKPVLVRVVAKQLFYGTGTPLAEIPGLHSQNMRDKPCRIVSAAGNFACDLFRQNFRGFRLTTPLFASHTRSSTSMRSWRGWNWGDGNFGGSGLQPPLDYSSQQNN